jgi:hypothetical protein
LLAGVLVAVTVSWALVRRRRAGRPGPPEASGAVEAPPLSVWVEAGELRAAAAAVGEQLRRAIARLEPAAAVGLPADALLAVLRLRRPRWPLQDLEDLLHALDRARFAPAMPSDVIWLQEQATTLAGRLAAPQPAQRTSRFEVASGEDG